MCIRDRLYPLNGEIVAVIIGILVILGFILPVLWINRHSVQRRAKIIIFFLLLNTFSFIILSIRSQRFIEYAVPIATLTIGYLIGNIFLRLPVGQDLRRRFLQKRSKFLFILISLGLVMLFYSTFSTVLSLREKSKGNLLDAGLWLNKNVPAGETIFHNNWADFPVLFFTNPKDKYILGADPISLYISDRKVYWLWFNISRCGFISINTKICDALLTDMNDVDIILKNTAPDDIYYILRNNFHAQYIFISHWQDSLLEKKIKSAPILFGEKYTNNLVKIYRLNN